MNNELLNIILTDKPEFVFQIFPYLDTNNIHFIQQNATKYAINNMIYPITQNNIDILTTLNLKFIEHSIQQKEFNKIYLEKQNDVFNSTTLLNVEQDLDINLYPGILSYIDNVIQARHSINFKHNLGLLPEYMNILTKNTSFIHYIFKNKKLKHIFNSEIIDHIKRLHEIGNVLGDDIKSFIIDGIIKKT